MSTINQTATTPSTGTSKDNLISDTRGLIEGYNHTETAQRNTARQIADNLAMLRDQHNMTQTDLGKVFGKAQGWVSQMLAWYDADFPAQGPFAAAHKRARKKILAANNRAAKRSRSGRKTTSEPNRLLAVIDAFYEEAALDDVDDQAFDHVIRVLTERRQADKAKKGKATTTSAATEPPAVTAAEGVRLAASQGVTMTKPEVADCLRLANLSEGEFEKEIAAAVAGNDINAEASAEEREAAHAAISDDIPPFLRRAPISDIGRAA